MASLDDVDECDGVFTHQDSCLDEVDSAKTVQFVDESHIPLTYCIDVNDDGLHLRSLKSNRLRMVHKSWGKQISNIVEESCGCLALLTTSGGSLDDHKIQALGSSIQKQKELAGSMHLLRYDAEHVLVHFTDIEKYDFFASAFQGNQIQCEGIGINRLEPVIQSNPPKCFIEIRTPHGEELHALLTETVLPFSSAFVFASILNQQKSCQQTVAGPTSFGITMLFDGANQKHASRAAKVLSQSPWQPVELPDAVSKALETTTRFFTKSNDSVPVWAIQDGCVQSGVQIMVFVRNRSTYSQMQQFYSQILGVQPFHREFPSGDTCYSVYALSTRAELVVAYYPGFISQHSESLSLCVQVKNVPDSDCGKSIGPGYWETSDPEGNSVVLFTVLK